MGFLTDLRTKVWLEHSFELYDSQKSFPGLIQQIRVANKPICISVGEHCMGTDIIPCLENKVIFERVKASGFNDRKWVHIH